MRGKGIGREGEDGERDRDGRVRDGLPALDLTSGYGPDTGLE